MPQTELHATASLSFSTEIRGMKDAFYSLPTSAPRLRGFIPVGQRRGSLIKNYLRTSIMENLMDQYDIRCRIRRHANPLDYFQLLRSLSVDNYLEVQPTDAQFALNPSPFLFHDLDFCELWKARFGCVFLLYGDELQDLMDYLRAKTLTLKKPVRAVLAILFPSMDSLEYAISCVLSGEVEDLSREVSASTQTHVSLDAGNDGNRVYLDSSVELFPEIQVFDCRHNRLWREGEHTDFAHKADGELVTCLLCGHAQSPTTSPIYTRWPPGQSPGNVFDIGPEGKPGWISISCCAQCEPHKERKQ